MVRFLLLSVTALLVLMVLSTKWRWLFKGAVIASVGLLATLSWMIFLTGNPVIFKGDLEPWWGRTPYREILLFTTMVVGMAAKYLWDLIEIRRAANAKRSPGEAKVGINFDAWDFVQPLLVAALVFAGVVATVKDFNATAYLFSFQNGFFWQAVLKQRQLAPKNG
jgi:hypothetical protein